MRPFREICCRKSLYQRTSADAYNEKAIRNDFRQALQDKRPEVAAKLLSETDDSVAAICKKVGFRSASHFYRSFGDRFGLTPSEYRGNRLEKKES